MNATAELPLYEDDLNTKMRKVARSLAMDIYTLPDILKNHGVDPKDFAKWQDNPTFLRYLKSEREEWTSANSTPDRVKVKAGIVVEEFIEEAHRTLHNVKFALNHRVELFKHVSRLAGMGEQKVLAGSGGGGPAFQLNINFGPNPNDKVMISRNAAPVIEHDNGDGRDFDANFETTSEDDEYDPFQSPDTLEDY